MLRQLHSLHSLSPNFAGAAFPAYAASSQRDDFSFKKFGTPAPVGKFPERPDASVINASIPLFFIGQNRKGRWVVREAEGRSGGLFLFKQWAVYFARRQSEPSGCAIMFLAEPIELDIDSQGRCAGPVPSAKSPSHSPSFLGRFAATVADASRRLAALVSRNIEAQRRNRAVIEQELFRGQYTLMSKHDDDLPLAL
jgi:hypothetical protein